MNKRMSWVIFGISLLGLLSACSSNSSDEPSGPGTPTEIVEGVCELPAGESASVVEPISTRWRRCRSIKASPARAR
jgi:hypothetical protein